MPANHLAGMGPQKLQVDLEGPTSPPLNMAFPDRSQHNMLLPLVQADLAMALLVDLVAPILHQTSMESPGLPAVSVQAILCRLSTALLVFQADLEAPVLYQFLADLVALAPCRLNMVLLVPQADLGVPVLCQRSMVLPQVPADSMRQAHSTPLEVDMLLQEEDIVPRKTILLSQLTTSTLTKFRTPSPEPNLVKRKVARTKMLKAPTGSSCPTAGCRSWNTRLTRKDIDHRSATRTLVPDTPADLSRGDKEDHIKTRKKRVFSYRDSEIYMYFMINRM